MDHAQLRHDIVTACRVLEAAGQADTVWGHVSIRDPEGRGVWLKGSNLGFDEVTEDDVILVGWNGDVVEGSAEAGSIAPVVGLLRAGSVR